MCSWKCFHITGLFSYYQVNATKLRQLPLLTPLFKHCGVLDELPVEHNVYSHQIVVV